MSEAMTETERVEQRIMKKTGPDLERVLADKFGDQLTAAQRHTIAHRIVRDMLDLNTKKSQDPKP